MTVLATTSNEPVAEFGPCMRSLHVRWQRAVLALFETRGNRTAALEIAGYKSDNRNSLKVMACNLFADARIKAAVREVAVTYIELAEPELLATVLEIMRDTGVRA